MTTEAIQAANLDPQIKAALELFSAAGVNTELDTNRGTIVADLTALRGAILALTAKLDADATIVATDFAATCNPAALTTSA